MFLGGLVFSYGRGTPVARKHACWALPADEKRTCVSSRHVPVVNVVVMMVYRIHCRNNDAHLEALTRKYACSTLPADEIKTCVSSRHLPVVKIVVIITLTCRNDDTCL